MKLQQHEIQIALKLNNQSIRTCLVQPDGAGRSNQTRSSDAPASALAAAEPSFSTELAIFTCQFPPKKINYNDNTRINNNNNNNNNKPYNFV